MLDLAGNVPQTVTFATLPGAGDGTFGGHLSSPGSTAFREVVAGDLDGDGEFTGFPEDSLLEVAFGSAKGLQAARGYDTSRNPSGIGLGDLDGDGALDVVVTSAAATGFGGNFVFYPNAGDGTLGDRTVYEQGLDAWHPVLADADGDGHADLLVVYRQLTNPAQVNGGLLAFSAGLGDGTFAPASWGDSGFGGDEIDVLDADGDGILDVVAANRLTDSLWVRLGTGNGCFGSVASFPAGDAPIWLAVGDVDEDGLQDVLTSNDGSADVSVLVGQGDGTFAAGATVPLPSGKPLSIELGDVDRDGSLDLATPTWVFLGHGDGSFSRPSAVTGSGSVARLADLDGDAALDHLTLASDRVRLSPGDGDGTFSPFEEFWLGRFLAALETADMDGDGIPDVVATTSLGFSDLVQEGELWIALGLLGE